MKGALAIKKFPVETGRYLDIDRSDRFVNTVKKKLIGDGNCYICENKPQ